METKGIYDGSKLLRVTFTLSSPDGQERFVLAWHAAGGDVNPDYRLGLRVLLERLARRKATIVDAYADTAKTEGVALEERRLKPTGFTLPLALNEAASGDKVRLGLQRAVCALTGSRTSRFCLVIAFPDGSPNRDDLERDLVGSEEGLADQASMDAAVAELRRRRGLGGTAPQPAGEDRPEAVAATVKVWKRLASEVEHVLHRSGGACEACGVAPFIKDDGSVYLEVHHVRRLADGGADRVDNAVAVCPTCHRALHHAANRNDLVKALLSKVKELRNS